MINQTLLLAGDDAYNLTKSLRFRSSASATLSRTPASASNRKTWTLSAWVKKSEVSARGQIFVANYSSVPWFVFGFENDNTLTISATAGSSASWKSTALFRDPSAWYHVMCVVDTTSATSTMSGSSTDRLRMYVNGTQYVMSGGTVPTQNSDLQVNNNVAHSICGYSTEYFGGYLGEVNFIDGQALTPSSFGETDLLTGVWKPKKYAGTYGTNGFYLPFTDNSALTTSSNVGLGKDFSGNSNYWVTNNISITAGTTYDSMTDVPTLTSATAANYAVFNPVNVSGGGSTITDGNLACNAGSVSTYGKILGSIGMTTGKWYCEITVTAIGSLGAIGLGDGTPPSGSTGLGGAAGELAYQSNGNKYTNATATAYGATYTTNDVIGIAYDADAGSVTFYKNNTSQGAITGLSGTKYFAVGSSGGTNPQYVANFGQRPFAYTPPTGFVALNTFNLPEPSIKAGNKHMDATTYTGNNGTQSLVNGGAFQPDLVWVKNRTNAFTHLLYDSVRGVGTLKAISSSETTAEGGMSDNSTFGYLSAINSDGFTVVSGSNANSYTNSSSNAYVGWQWKANGTGSSNTAGSITSTVSANPTAGFSVVTYTGSGSNGTVGHGLGIAPKMIFVKDRTQGGTYRDWAVYNADIGAGNSMYLNSTSGSFSKPSYWNSTTATSSVFSLGSDITVNQSGDAYVAYCFAPVAGYSAFGSYTGNGSTDGVFLHLGFRPKFVMIKSTGSQDWVMLDSSTNPYNVAGNYLRPNSSGAENGGSTPTTSTYEDFLSNGIKFRNDASSSGYTNGSGVTYIYMAFAENPFKYSLAR